MIYKNCSEEGLSSNSCFQKIDDMKIAKITIVSFYEDYIDLISDFKSFRSNITPFISINSNLKNTNPALKYILNFTTYISILYNFGENILFEDTKDLNISYIMTSMVKLINNPRFCTINACN
ncbi:hypothetical protein MXB_1700 [Myxobolus squamalis]|nr:hypothetical protein MXB_1700 [Myxobolus squamalis]